MYTYVRALLTQANEMRTRPFVLSRVNSEGRHAAAFFLLCHGGPSWKARPGNLFKVIFEGRLRRQFCTEHISKHLARTFSGFFLLEIISGKDAKRYLRKVFHLQVYSLESSTNFRFLSTYTVCIRTVAGKSFATICKPLLCPFCAVRFPCLTHVCTLWPGLGGTRTLPTILPLVAPSFHSLRSLLVRQPL